VAELLLPISLTGKKELIKVQRELESLSEAMIATKVSNKELGQPRPLPTLSDVTSELVSANEIVLDSKSVPELIKQLQAIRDRAPMLRVSFAVEPDRASIAKIVSWFRKEINPGLLLQVGIQPSIAGGCVVQTPGNRYDFSLRKHILGSTDKFKAVLAKEVFGHNEETEVAEPIAATTAADVVAEEPANQGEQA